MKDEPERGILRALLLRGSELGARIFRNQIGQYRLAMRDCARCQRMGRVMRSGLCVGSSDLIGWVPTLVTPEMVGTTIALFVAVEAKTATGTLTPEQKAFLQAVRAAGGLGMVARSVTELETALAPKIRRVSCARDCQR